MAETVQPTEEMKKVNSPRERNLAQRLTGAEYDESMMMAGIIAREIRHSGKFSERLGDMAYAYSRSRKGVTPERGEMIIRDQFKAIQGKTMNDYREAMMDREKKVDEHGKAQALSHAREIGKLIQEGETMPFYRAYDQAATRFAEKLQITEAGAKTLMKDAFREHGGKELYDWGKGIEAEHHTPVREAQKKSERENAGYSRPENRIR